MKSDTRNLNPIKIIPNTVDKAKKSRIIKKRI